MPKASSTARSVRRPSSATRTRMTVQARRDQLIEIGLRAFNAQPYHEVSIDAIAREAGISRGLLFHYFSTKHKFYVAILRRASRALLAHTFAPVEGTPFERLRAGLGAYFLFMDEHCVAYSGLMRGGVGVDPEVQELLESTRCTIRDRILDELGELPPDETRALRTVIRGWIGLVEAISFDWIEHRDVPRERLVDIAVRALRALVPDATVLWG